MTDSSILIDLDAITLRVRDRHLLAGTSWTIRSGEQWAIIGANGSGKSTLAGALCGKTPVVAGRVRYGDSKTTRPRTALISFESHRQWIAQDEAFDAAREFSGQPGEAGSARSLLGAYAEHLTDYPVFDSLATHGILDRPFRTLSTGEIRRLLVARAVFSDPELLILDEPFDGLDPKGRSDMRQLMSRLTDDGMQLVVVTHRWRQLPDTITHTLVLSDDRVIYKGVKPKTPAEIEAAASLPPLPDLQSPGDGFANRHPEPIRLESVAVRFGDIPVLENVNWQVQGGDHWVLLGPNGAGKSTLMRMVIGDHPQAYANQIYLFGKRRGSGESIWDIKRRIGMVSAEFQIRYRRPLSASDVVASGYFDSVGLYRHPSAAQRSAGTEWMARLGVSHLAGRNFTHLSRGEQRLILLARALVKPPELLVLDEPCQGLDPDNRSRFLAMVDRIGQCGMCQILYITHYLADIPSCFQHILRFVPVPGGGFTTRSEQRNELPLP